MKDLKTGTTTLAIKCKDGVIIAADKRVTAGHEVVNTTYSKVVKLTSNILVAIAGDVAEIQRLLKVMSSEIKLNELHLGRKMLVKEVVSQLTNIVYSNFRTPSMMVPITAFIVGGVDGTGAHIFEINPAGSNLEVNTFAADGSGGTFAISVLEDSYSKDLNIKEGVELAKRAIDVALKRDTASGNGFLIYSITDKGANLEADEIINTGLKK
jgi:proteasome beta subunit